MLPVPAPSPTRVVSLHPKFTSGSDGDHPKSDLADLGIPHPAIQSAFSSSSQVKHIQKCANDPIQVPPCLSLPDPPTW